MLGYRARRAFAAWLLVTFTLAPFVLPGGGTAVAESPPTERVEQPQINGDPLSPGTTAIVNTNDGSCLRLRASASITAERVDCVPEGRTVLVLPATQLADGFRWQLVEWRGRTGWVADAYLAPYSGPPIADSCQASSIAPGITGEVPTQGGLSIVTWGGGTPEGLQTATLADGCVLQAIWATRPDGGFVSYRFDVPSFVNQPWHDAVGSVMAAGTPLLIVCGQPVSAITTESLPLPGATAAAPTLTGNEAAPAIGSRAAIVIDEASGEVLYERNGYEPLPIASLTKIATAILAIEGAPVDAWAPISDVDYRQMPGSSVMGIIPGDCFTVRDLLYGLMLPSGNDAALAIGRFQAGSDEAFVRQMNALVQRLGLTSTTFTDPHGLGGPRHRSSAYDVAMMSRYGMSQFPLFREIVSKRSWTAVGDRDLSMVNVNSFLGQYGNADGVKTGFTGAAGRTLSASATRDGRRLYAVVLNDPNRHTTAEKLLEWAFSNYTWP